MKAILLEFYKLRHRYLFLMTTSFILVEILFLFMSISRSISQNPETADWNALIVMFASMNGLLFPILIAILVSRICDMEHKGGTWKLLRSLCVNHGQIYRAKYICASIFVLLACIIQVLSIAVFGIYKDFQNSVPVFLLVLFFSGIFVTSIFLSKLIVISVLLFIVQGLFILLYFIGGKVAGLSTTVPSELSGWFFRGWISAITISTLQLALSMHIRSFAIPIGIGFCSAIVGLVMYILNLGMFFPHSLLTIGMGILSQTGFSSLNNHLLFFAMNLFYSFMISIVAIGRMRKLDVVA